MKSSRFFAVVALSTASVLPAPADLIGHWDFEEGAGSVTADRTAGAHDLTFEGGPQWTTDDLAPVGSGTSAAIGFDGIDDRLVAVGYKVPEITDVQPRTMAAWVKAAPGAPFNMGIIAYGQDQAGDKWILRAQDSNGVFDGTLRVEINGGYVTGTTDITDGQWHHVAATFEDDGSPDVLDVKLFVDGVLEAYDGTTDEVLHTDTAAGIDLRIGDDHSNRKWNGWIDDVRIYNEVLDEAAILALATGVPVISSFAGDEEAISAGSELELIWTVDEDAETLEVNNGVGNVLDDTVAGSGSITVSPAATTTYTLTGTRGGETLSRDFLVLVGEAPRINAFTASATEVGFGDSVDLAWSLYGEDTASLTTVGDVSGQNSANVTPAGETTYTLSATNSFGTTTADIVVSAKTAGTPELGWSAADLPDGPLSTWDPSVNLTGNDGITFTAGTVATVESGASNFGAVRRWVNSPDYSLAANPLDSWQDGLGNPATQENVTWELVFRPGDFIGTHTLFNTGGNGDGTAITLIDGTLEFRFQDANSDEQRVIAATDLSAIGAATDFYHVVGVADVDSAAAGTGTLYVNGVARSGPITSTGTINDWDGGDLAELGKGNNIPGGNPFNPDAFSGDIAAFNYHAGKLLSPELINTLYSRYQLPPIIGSFESDTVVAAVGADVTLSWEADDDTEGLSIDNGVGDVFDITVDGEGSIVVNPTETTTYVLTGTREGDFQTAEVTVLVGVAPIISSFATDGTDQIADGGTAVLAWDVFGADSLVITPGDADVSELDSIEVSPAAATTYTLTASNAFGETTAEATVTVRSANLVAHYNFTAEPNPTLVDESGNGNEVDVTFGIDNPVWLPEDGGRSGILSFNDTPDAYVQLVSPPVVPPAGQGFTVMVWAKSDFVAQTQFGTLFANGQGAGNHFQIDADGNGNWRVRDQLSVNTAFGPIVEEWTHLALTFDGTNRVMYYNGVATGPPVQSDPGSTFDEYRISMNRANDANGPVDAEIDDLRVYDFALSAEAVMEAMNQNAPGSVLEITDIVVDPGADSVTLTWSSLPGRFYSIDSTTSLEPDSWLEVTDSWESEGGETSFTHNGVGLSGKPELFYRVRED